MSDAAKKDLPSYEWQEVAKHNTAESMWVSSDGFVYDITPWLKNHPGGEEMLLLCAGRDVTDMLTSYHPFSDKPQAVMKKYLIGRAASTEFPTYKPDTGFYRTLRKRVKEYFDRTGKDPKAPMAGLWRMACVFAAAAVFFAISCGWLGLPFAVRCVAAVLFGACQALPLLHVMHDASHTAIGSTEGWWRVVGQFCMEWYAGASMTSWHNQHIVGHHLYTNVMGADPDLPAVKDGDIRYLVARQVFRAIYKLQHIYLPFLYGLLAFKFRVGDLLVTFAAEKNGPVRVNPIAKSTWARMLASKVFWGMWRIYYPLVVLGMPAGQFWTLFTLIELSTGYYLAFNFQVSHVSDDADWPASDSMPEQIPDEWAVSQLKTSIDYSHGDAWQTFLCGALNYQIVHHLLPSISQYHYPDIAPIVVRTAKEFNLPYTVLPNFRSALFAHFHYLYTMGQKGRLAHID